MTGGLDFDRGLVVRLLDRLAADGHTLAVAESLTGGLLAAAVTDVPGASRLFRGGVVAYQNDVKAGVLGVPADTLAVGGAVQGEVALAMAAGVRALLGASWGLATTGVAGPEPVDGQPPGTVFVAAVGEEAGEVRRLDLGGDRAAVRKAAVTACLGLLAGTLHLPAPGRSHQ